MEVKNFRASSAEVFFDHHNFPKFYKCKKMGNLKNGPPADWDHEKHTVGADEKIIIIVWKQKTGSRGADCPKLRLVFRIT